MDGSRLQMPQPEMPSLAARGGCTRDKLDFTSGLHSYFKLCTCPLYKVEVPRGLWGRAKFPKRDIRGGKVAVEAGAASSRHRGWKNAACIRSEPAPIEMPACPQMNETRQGKKSRQLIPFAVRSFSAWALLVCTVSSPRRGFPGCQGAGSRMLPLQDAKTFLVSTCLVVLHHGVGPSIC